VVQIVVQIAFVVQIVVQILSLLTIMEKPTLTYFFDTRSKLLDGNYPIKLTVYYGRQKKRYKTPFKATQELYDRLLANRLRDESTKQLKRQTVTWLDKQTQIAESIVPFTFTDFENIFYAEKTKSRKIQLNDGVSSIYESHIQTLKDEGRISTASSYQDSLTSILSYKKNLKVSQVTPEFLKGYEKWMTDNGRSLTTVGMYLRALRTIFNLAIENEVIDPSKYPFKKYTIPAPQKISRTLKKEEIKLIINYTAKRESDAIALDYWVFSFISNGMNFKDIALLKYENIEGDFIIFRRAKTKRTTKNNSLPIMVPIDGSLEYIIMKRGNKSKKKDDYIFPILKKGLTPQQEYDHIKTFIRNTNKRLARVGKELGLSLKVTSYVARHCFATIQKNNNAPLAYISEALGHSNLKTTQNYFGRFEDESLKAFHSGLMEGMVD
jgi:integrase/recombinase XerD